MPSCIVCAATWTGTAPCHCTACHVTFTVIELFDAHRTGRGPHGGCLDPPSSPPARRPRVGVGR